MGLEEQKHQEIEEGLHFNLNLWGLSPVWEFDVESRLPAIMCSMPCACHLYSARCRSPIAQQMSLLIDEGFRVLHHGPLHGKYPACVSCFLVPCGYLFTVLHSRISTAYLCIKSLVFRYGGIGGKTTENGYSVSESEEGSQWPTWYMGQSDP